MDLLLATTNSHKLDEIRAVIDLPSINWLTLAQVDADGRIDEPIEDQPTFEGNAQLKAQYYADATGLVTVADDSGLSVDALGGQPGVRSARYARELPQHQESWAGMARLQRDLANNARLLDELADVPNARRTARFVCVMAMVWPAAGGGREHGRAGEQGQEQGEANPAGDGRAPIVVRGEVVGRILLAEECAETSAPMRGRGVNGFGYDPLFQLPDDHPTFAGKTTAELTPEQKNSISHRGEAARLLAVKLRERRP